MASLSLFRGKYFIFFKTSVTFRTKLDTFIHLAKVSMNKDILKKAPVIFKALPFLFMIFFFYFYGKSANFVNPFGFIRSKSSHTKDKVIHNKDNFSYIQDQTSHTENKVSHI